MSKLLIGESLRYGQADTPTREGEVINYLEEIYNIPTPFVGMRVYCKQTGKAYTITSLESEIIGGKKVFNKVGTFEAEVKEVTWVNEGNVSNMNDFVEAGIYDIKGEHTRIDDNLPFANTGSGHTFHARLEVLDSSITPEGKSDDICITQKLTLSNRVAGDGDVYIRTGRGASKEAITWEKWGKLQQNIEVGLIEPGVLKSLIDNGIYSGMIKKGAMLTDYETFVMVVINDYAVAGENKRISQFKYALDVGGKPRYESRYAYIEEGNTVHSWTDWEILNQNEISSMIAAEIKKVTDGIDPEKIDSIKDIIAWVEEHGGEVEAIYNAIEGNTKKIDEEIERSVSADLDLRNMVDDEQRRAEQAEEELDNKITNEVEKLKNGNIIVAQAREIHSRKGKTVTDSFLVRTTAGSGTIGDGVATLKSVGGNIVKNLVDGTFATKQYYDNAVIEGKIYKKEVASAAYPQLYYQDASVPKIVGHKYYFAADVIYNGVSCTISIDNGSHTNRYTDVEKWQRVSIIGSAGEGKDIFIRANSATYIWAIKPLLIDLTYEFGETKANQMTKEECDKLFGTMDALPQGLTIANPKEFKSTDYNQADPSKMLANKGIENGAIVDKVGSNLAVVPCLPCKIGEGENNGYCIHGAFDEGAEKVYLTPLNPLEVEGELYLCELTKDADKGTYVPQIKGYMLVEVPDATDLCVHFLWSEDRGRHYFEPYYESVVELPTIPEMPEYGLAGIQTSGALACDEIDFVKGVYRKKIIKYVFNGGASEVWYKTGTSTFYSSGLKRVNTRDSLENRCILISYSGLIKKAGGDNKYTLTNETNGILYITPTFTNITEVEAWREYLAQNPLELYYELETPEEYPLQKVANNYTSSDYGVEQFDSKVPCNANNLYYMRSLAGETRNFLDRMYANTGKEESPIAVADYITTNIAENKAKAEEAPNLALRALYIAAGAEYNDTDNIIIKTAPWGESVEHLPKHYYLNGLGDITENEMTDIYVKSYQNYVTTEFVNAFRKQISSEWNIKTNLRTKSFYPICNTTNLTGCCYTNSTIGVFVISHHQESLKNPINLEYAFYKCYNLKAIIGNIIVDKINTITFGLCEKLQEIRLNSLKTSIILGDSPFLSKASILHIIQNAAPTTAITITLHSDAYARLKDDADIVAALAAQPLVTLVSA